MLFKSISFRNCLYSYQTECSDSEFPNPNTTVLQTHTSITAIPHRRCAKRQSNQRPQNSIPSQLISMLGTAHSSPKVSPLLLTNCNSYIMLYTTVNYNLRITVLCVGNTNTKKNCE